MAISKAGLNSQSVRRIDKMLRVTTSTTLSVLYGNIIDGSGLTVTVPSGVEDGQKCEFTWEFGSDFTLSGVFTTSLGDDTEILFIATDKPALVTLTWKSATSRWSV